MRTFLLLILFAVATGSAAERPNIVFILADDLGVGDVHAFNPAGKIATPRLESAGGRGDEVDGCTYAVVGLHADAVWAAHGALQLAVAVAERSAGRLSPRLIEPGRMTVAQLLKDQGYATACIGKWHLGLDWVKKPGGAVTELDIEKPEQNKSVDFTQPFANGPRTLGFDYYFGIAASLDMVPYTFLENDRCTVMPTTEKKFPMMGDAESKGFTRFGPAAEEFEAVDVLPRLAERAGKWIEEHAADAKAGKPFFSVRAVEFAAHAIAAGEGLEREERAECLRGFRDADGCDRRCGARRAGKGGAVGADVGHCDERQWVFAAGAPRAAPRQGPRPVQRVAGDEGGYLGGRASGAAHRALAGQGEAGDGERRAGVPHGFHGDLRGPHGGEAAGQCGRGQREFFAGVARGGGCADDAGFAQHRGAFRDSERQHEAVPDAGSGGWSAPKPGSAGEKELPDAQLYDLAADPAEARNLIVEQPDKVKELTALLEKYVAEGRSTPGERQKNTVGVKIRKGRWSRKRGVNRSGEKK
jgi:hypothetical protein